MAAPLMRAVPAALLLVLLELLPVAGQQHGFRVEVQPGARVRLTLHAGGRVNGTVAHMRGDTLVLRGEGEGAAPGRLLSVGALRQLEVPADSRDRARGALRGAAVLGGVAAVFGTLDGLPADEVASGVLGNGIVGALIGLFVAPRGWQRVPLPRPPAQR